MILGLCRGGENDPNLTGFTFIRGRDRRKWRVKAHAAAAVTVWATAAFFRQPTTTGPIGYCRSPQYETNAARMDFIGALSRRESLVKASGIDALQLPLDLGDGRPRSDEQERRSCASRYGAPPSFQPLDREIYGSDLTRRQIRSDRAIWRHDMLPRHPRLTRVDFSCPFDFDLIIKAFLA